MTNSFVKFFVYSSILPIVIIYSFVVIFFAVKGIQQQTLLLFTFMFALGILIWSFVEYLIHRFLFHKKFMNDRFKKFQYFMHGYHHMCPRDPRRVALPLIITLPLSTLIYFLMTFIFGVYAEAIFSGFVLGYIIYDLSHYAIHHFSPKTTIGKFRKYYHFRHHFKANHRCYGVSSPLWDLVFGTYQKIE